MNTALLSIVALVLLLSTHTAAANSLTFVSGSTNITLCDGGRTVCGVSSAASASNTPSTFFQPGLGSGANFNNSLFVVTLTKDKDYLDFSPGFVVMAPSASCRSFVYDPSSKNAELQCIGLPVPGGADIDVSVGVSVNDDDGGQVHFGPVSVLKNTTSVVSVMLPAALSLLGDCPPAPPSVDDGEDESDSLIFPASSGVVVPKPASRRASRETGWIYPGKAALQFVARRCGSSAVYIQPQDTSGHVKEFGYEISARPHLPSATLLSVTHHVDTVNATSGAVVIPYTTSIAVLAGTVSSWQSVAERYRSWVLAAFPAAKKLADRDDVPDSFKGTSGGGGVAGGIFGIQTSDGFNPNALGPNLELLHRKTAQMQRAVTAPGSPPINFIAPVYGWEHDGTWAGIEYFPAQPSNAAWRNVASVPRAQVALLVSGWWWVVKRQKTGGGPAFDNSAMLHNDPANVAMLIKNTTKQTLFEVNEYDNPTGRQSWRGLSVQLCHGAAAAQRTMSDIFANVSRQLGVTMISFDQDIGGGQMKPCYDHTHNHPPGLGKWAWEGQRDTMRQIKQRSGQKQLVLLSEQCSELATMDPSTAYTSCWSRQFAPLDFPFFRARMKGIFSFVYHEYNMALAAAEVQGVENGQQTTQAIFTRVKAYANSLARGLPLVPFESAVLKDATLRRAYYNYNKHGFSRYGSYLVASRVLSFPGGDSFVNCSSAIMTVKLHSNNNNSATFCSASVGRFAAQQGSGGGGQPMTFVANAASSAISIMVGGQTVHVPALDVVALKM